MFNFDTKKTTAHRSLSILSIPIFKYSSILSQACLFFFIVSLAFIPLYLLEIVSVGVAVKIPAIFLLALIIFCQIYFFTESKIKKQNVKINLSEVISKSENYNLADFLSLASCQIVEKAIKLCKAKKLNELGSEALLYSSLVNSKVIRSMIFRLGINHKDLEVTLLDLLGKQQGQGSPNLSFSESFEKTIVEAFKIADQKGKKLVGEREVLESLAKNDDFFAKVLVQYELKEKDVEDIAMWLDDVESRIESNKQFWTKENLLKFGSVGKDFASGFTVTLDQFSVNWWEIARGGLHSKIVGHQKEIQEVETILTKSSFKNVMIVGEVGVGRKSIVQAVAKRCYFGEGLEGLKNKKVVELDMVALLSRIQDQENLESTIDQIFQEVIQSGNTILVIDELDKFVEQNKQKPGAVDISGILSKYLSVPEFLLIAITSYAGLHNNLEKTPSFIEYFRKVEVSEVSEAETIIILQNLAVQFEQKYKVFILYPSIREIVSLSSRYFPNVPFPKKAIDVLDESVSYAKSLKEKILLPSHIDKIISEKTQVPVGKVEFKEKEVLIDLEKLIHERIINQEEAVKEIAIAMRRARAGIASKKRPMGTFLFLGPTGVGKTETAKALAQIYFGSEDKMIRIDMSEFQAISDIPRLIGAVSPVEQQGLLTTPVRENPFSLVLLDEVEKAHSNILNLFLQVFDEGHITDGQGRKIVFTNTIIICTSNAGADIIFKSAELGDSLDKDKLFSTLFERGVFRPEFINRFDAAVLFHPLTKDNLNNIAQLMLASLAKNLKEKDIEFEITEELKEKIVKLSYKPQFGAREMRRVIQDKVENSVAEALLSDKIVKGDKIKIDEKSFKIVKV